MPASPQKNKALLFGGIGLVLAAIGVIISLVLLNKPQDTRNKAAVEGGTAKVQISPTVATLKPGEKTTATVSFTTEGTWIQGLAVQLSYPYTGAQPPLVASDIKIDPTVEASGRFNCSIKNIVATSSPVTINFGCNTTAGYSNTGFTDLFTFTLTAGTTGTDAPIPITFNTSQTIIAEAGQDIAAIPTSSLTVSLPKQDAVTQKNMTIAYTTKCNPAILEASALLRTAGDQPSVDSLVKFSFNNQNLEKRTGSDGKAVVSFSYAAAGSYVLVVNADGFTEQRNTVAITACPAATATPTPEPVATATPTPTPAATPTPTPTQSVNTVSCNGICTTNSNCAAGLSCYSGRCRSTSCQSDATCQCQASNVASTSGTTQLPTTGSFDRAVALLLIGGLLTIGGIQVLLGREADAS
ncbi:hypothetical protein KA012_00425 [Candidatus Woesebacteria bacterium]|nr:hypothetical protein [Candidatus Woesebacteria bacterium]